MWASFVPWLQTLLGGLGGAVLGAWIAGKYSERGFNKERESRETQRRSEFRTYVVSELKLNRRTLEQPGTWHLHRLSVEAWRVARGDVGFLGTDTRDTLLELYAVTQSYNDRFDMFLANGTRLPDTVDVKDQVVSLIDKALELLERRADS